MLSQGTDVVVYTMGFLLNRWMVNLNPRKIQFWVRVIFVETSSFSTVWLSLSWDVLPPNSSGQCILIGIICQMCDILGGSYRHFSYNK